MKDIDPATALAAIGSEYPSVTENRELLHEVLAELRSHRINQTDLDVFELHVLDGLTHSEIYSQVGKSIGAVYTALSRARKKVESEFASRGKSP